MILGTALLITAVSLVLRPQLARFAYRKGRSRPERPARTAAWTVLTGAILGMLVSFTSVGAGAIGVTVLLLLYPRLATVRIVGSDVAHAVPLTLIAGAGHWMMGSVDWSLLVSLLVGSIPGIVIGSNLSSKAPEALLRYLLAATLVLVGLKLVFS